MPTKLIRFIALILLLLGVFAAFVGYAYRAPNATLATGMPKVAFLESIARDVRALPFKTREKLNISREGLFPSFVGGGGGLILISLILFVLSSRKSAPAARPAAKQSSRKRTIGGSTMATTTAETDAVAQSNKQGLLSDMDDAIRRAEDEDDDVFSDIGRVISLSHSSMEEPEILAVIRKLLPDLLEFTSQMPPAVQEKFAKQALNIYIIKTKRSEKEIAPDQFRIQDTRMNELIRETIARRFIPSKTDHLAKEALPLIGNVYTLQEQARIQQDTESHSEDWRDLSVRNAADVMRINPHA